MPIFGGHPSWLAFTVYQKPIGIGFVLIRLTSSLAQRSHMRRTRVARLFVLASPLREPLNWRFLDSVTSVVRIKSHRIVVLFDLRLDPYPPTTNKRRPQPPLDFGRTDLFGNNIFFLERLPPSIAISLSLYCSPNGVDHFTHSKVRWPTDERKRERPNRFSTERASAHKSAAVAPTQQAARKNETPPDRESEEDVPRPAEHQQTTKKEKKKKEKTKAVN